MDGKQCLRRSAICISGLSIVLSFPGNLSVQVEIGGALGRARQGGEGGQYRDRGTEGQLSATWRRTPNVLGLRLELNWMTLPGKTIGPAQTADVSIRNALLGVLAEDLRPVVAPFVSGQVGIAVVEVSDFIRTTTSTAAMSIVAGLRVSIGQLRLCGQWAQRVVLSQLGTVDGELLTYSSVQLGASVRLGNR